MEIRRPISLIVRQHSIFIMSLLLDDFPLKKRAEYVILSYYHSCWIGCDSCSQKDTNISLSLRIWRFVVLLSRRATLKLIFFFQAGLTILDKC